MKFKVITPSANGHDTAVLDNLTLLTEWVDGIDFSGLGGKINVAVEDEIVSSRAAFMDEVNRLIQQHADGEFARDTIEVRMMRPMAGG